MERKVQLHLKQRPGFSYHLVMIDASASGQNWNDVFADDAIDDATSPCIDALEFRQQIGFAPQSVLLGVSIRYVLREVPLALTRFESTTV
jgi:hypothetical protein